MFRALLLHKSNGDVTPHLDTLSPEDLPPGDTHVRVLYSSINYKDALAVANRAPIIRGDFPIAPGIDLVGEVVSSESDRWDAGDRVIGTGWGLGEDVWGGYTEEVRVQADQLVALPEGLSPQQAMTIGTAGFTAMLSVMALEDHGLTPDSGEVVVTGASGGAGSMAVALLSQAGYTPVASTGSENAHAYLDTLGATRIVHRDMFSDGPKHPMESGQWAGAIDAVGGDTLATLIAQLKRHGSVASFGNAAGHELHTTVLPFILRGVNLLGIDSNTCPNDRRRTAWARLDALLTDDLLERMTYEVVNLDAVPDAVHEVLDGDTRGRIVVDVQGG